MIIFVQWLVGIIGFRLTYKVTFFSICETIENHKRTPVVVTYNVLIKASTDVMIFVVSSRHNLLHCQYNITLITPLNKNWHTLMHLASTLDYRYLKSPKYGTKGLVYSQLAC